MQKICIIFFFVLLQSTAKAQFVQQVEYDTCTLLKTLEGEWMNVNGEDTIRVYLKYNRGSVWRGDPERNERIVDDLYGWTEIKKGSNVVFSDYSNRAMNWYFNLDEWPFFVRNAYSISLSVGTPSPLVRPYGYNFCKIPLKEIGGRFYDKLRCETSKTVLGILNPSGREMTWYVRMYCAFFVRPLCWESTLPAEFVLKKQ